MFAEMKTIPDYPAYAVTKDGQVWSYRVKRFLNPTKKKYRSQVKLIVDGIGFFKQVHRLVFETFYGYIPECIIHKDGDVHNNHLSNLVGMTRDEHNKMIHSRKETRVIYQVDLKEGITRKLRMPEPNEPIYSSLLHCLERKPQKITCHGYIYYYEDKKHRIVEELKSRIKTSTLALQCMDDYNPFRRTVKDSNIRNKKYLEILERV
ncbi:HNH endonuclease signature motif containing protein [Lactococcus lactis]|uniref:HNH endonuclease signature motif containing protein n=1 Tax=Lactococcus lactis TaxID=1358 RepID=UPI001D18E311|nr:HNH endonuclease signature motif containing protein [Lactococcus lactis]MCC4119886.1 HNH endonuclease [Lactococcus lactis]